MQTRKFESRY